MFLKNITNKIKVLKPLGGEIVDYKCRYNGKFSCENCKHGTNDEGVYLCKFDIEENNCIMGYCPIVHDYTYPESEHWCKMCSFEPKEEMRSLTTEEAEAHKRMLNRLSVNTGVNVLNFMIKEDTDEMIMTEEEMDEQLEMMERLEEEGYYDDESVDEWVRVDDGLITVKLSKEQIKNILEFFDLRFIYFIQDQGDEIDNIWYLESMSTAYATLARAIGQEPKGA